MILLDTNVLSELMRPNPAEQVIRWLDDQPISSLYICSVTRAEIELGLALRITWGLVTSTNSPCCRAAVKNSWALPC